MNPLFRPWSERLDNLPVEAVLTVEGLPWPRVARGKVREVFDLGDAYLMVASDRLSAFDVIMREGIPGKGVILTQMSLFWFDQVARRGLVPHHLMPGHEAALADRLADRPELIARSMLVRKLSPLPLEAVVRGYLAGSGWKAYRETGRLFDLEVPAGLRESARLPRPLFTPSTKAKSGHDLPLSQAEGAALLGAEQFAEVERLSLAIYDLGVEIAGRAGILLADTKFEFGLDAAGGLFLIDEILTPDSSRYWPADRYQPGGAQASYDKQFVRDFLETCAWDKTPPPPSLPPEIIAGTLERYRQAYREVVRAGGSAGSN